MISRRRMTLFSGRERISRYNDALSRFSFGKTPVSRLRLLAMFALCMSRGQPTIQDVHHQNCCVKQVKGGYLLRYRKTLFFKGWSEEWVVLYEDSTIAWYKDKGLGKPRGRIRIGDSPDLLAVGEWTRKVPRRPRFPRHCRIGQLLAIGSRKPQNVHWLIAQSQAEVDDWMTAISNTLPPPPQLPLEDKIPPHKQPPPQQTSAAPRQHPCSLVQKPHPNVQKPTPSAQTSRQNYENDHTVITGVEQLGWGHGWGWGGALCASAEVSDVAVSSALYCQNLEDYGVSGYEEMDWSAFGDFCF